MTSSADQSREKVRVGKGESNGGERPMVVYGGEESTERGVRGKGGVHEGTERVGG